MNLAIIRKAIEKGIHIEFSYIRKAIRKSFHYQSDYAIKIFTWLHFISLHKWFTQTLGLYVQVCMKVMYEYDDRRRFEPITSFNHC